MPEGPFSLKELNIYPWSSEVARDTLKALIAEMKTERQTKLAEAHKTYEAPSDPGVKYWDDDCLNFDYRIFAFRINSYF